MNKNQEQEMAIESEDNTQLCERFLIKNYDYLWLKTMLEKAKLVSDHTKATLVTGSSHALNGVKETAWTNAVNCSMHSQDLYYDFLCARTVMEGTEQFQRCFIVFGYYIAYQDLSLSQGTRDYMVSPVYYPIFGDAHHWEMPQAVDIWKDFGSISEEMREACEEWAGRMIREEATYYSRFRRRRPFFDFGGRFWQELSEEEQDRYARKRADSHNSVLKYTDSFYENRQILKDYVHFLRLKGVMPIVVIPPFSSAYNSYVAGELKMSVTEMMDAVSEELVFVDFNKDSIFENIDFMDTDHLTEQGAEKMSRILVERFGR